MCMRSMFHSRVQLMVGQTERGERKRGRRKVSRVFIRIGDGVSPVCPLLWPDISDPQPSDQGATLDTSTTVQPSDQDKDVGRDAEAGTLSTKSPEKLTRCVRQLFVRGDNIVLVAPVHRTQPLAEDK